jgi:Ras-related protein Rab-5C
MLVGNKSDLSSARKTSRELGEGFAEEEGLLFAEASAKSGEGVEGLFMEIGQYLFFLLLPAFFLHLPCRSLS